MWLPHSLEMTKTASRLTQSSFCCPVFADKSIRSSKIKLVLSVNGGSQLQAFPTIDGSFLFPSVPAGTHMLDVVSVDLLFPQVRVKHAVCLLSIQAGECADHVGTHRCRWQHR